MNIDAPLDDLVRSSAEAAHSDGDGPTSGGGYSRRRIVVRDLETGAVTHVNRGGGSSGGSSGGVGGGGSSGDGGGGRGRRHGGQGYSSRGGVRGHSARRPIVVKDLETGAVRTCGDSRWHYDSGGYESGGYDSGRGGGSRGHGERRHRVNPIVVRDPQTGSTRVLGEDRRGGSNRVRSGYISKRSPPRHSPTAVPEPKILISNLHYEVNDSDIYDLFTNIGPLVGAHVIYDRSGSHSGRGEVTFERYEHAVEAVKRYNGVPLDNRPLEIQLSEDSAPLRLTRSGRNTGRRLNLSDTNGDLYDNAHYNRPDYDRR